MLQLEFGESKPEKIAVKTVHNRDEKSSVLLVGNAEIECRQRTGRGRMPRLEPRQSLEKSSIVLRFRFRELSPPPLWTPRLRLVRVWVAFSSSRGHEPRCQATVTKTRRFAFHFTQWERALKSVKVKLSLEDFVHFLSFGMVERPVRGIAANFYPYLFKNSFLQRLCLLRIVTQRV